MSGTGNPGSCGIEIEALAERQADHAGELQLHLLEFIDRIGGALRLRAELHLGAQHVDAGDDAALFQVDRLLVQGPRRLLLGARGVGARGGGQGLTNRLPATWTT